jgi:hypothetical protein
MKSINSTDVNGTNTHLLPQHFEQPPTSSHWTQKATTCDVGNPMLNCHLLHVFLPTMNEMVQSFYGLFEENQKKNLTPLML